MTSLPPPHGLNEVDYETIEAAVTETVRGRWFLAEFARRNRMTETRQLLDAMARIEAAVSGGQVALPTADPSIRLLVQRIKEIAGQLGTVAGEMRDAGIDDRFVSAIDHQARAVAGMMRSATPARDVLPAPEAKPVRAPLPVTDASPPEIAPPAPPIPRNPAPASPMPRLPRAEPMLPNTRAEMADDPRLALLSGLDGMPLAQKLALFS